jgi:hypothetical protein
MVKSKNVENWRARSFYYQHILHVTLQYIGFLLASLIFFVSKNKGLDGIPFLPVIFVGFIMALMHLFIDIFKEIANKIYKGKGLLWFVLDQILHVIVILLCVVYLNKHYSIHTSLTDIKNLTPLIQCSLICLGLIILIKPTSIFVMKFLSMAMSNGKTTYISVTKSHVAKMFDDALSKDITGLVTTDQLTRATVDAKIDMYIKNANMVTDSLESKKNKLSVDVENVFATNNAGKWIGYTERVMIFSLYLLGQFTAIAAVMAIKTAFRFNDLKDDNDSQRSEYIMLGTFASLFCTILIAVLVKHFIGAENYSGLKVVFKTLF